MAPPRSAAFQAAATLASSRHGTREEPGRQDAGVAAGWKPALRGAPIYGALTISMPA
jgi:hypothetical protein